MRANKCNSSFGDADDNDHETSSKSSVGLTEEQVLELFRSHAQQVRAYLYRELRDSNDVEDVMQEVFLKMLRAREKYNPARNTNRGWVKVITRNTLFDFFKYHINRRPASLDVCIENDTFEPIDLGVAHSNTLALLEEYLQTIDPEKAKVVRLRFIDGLNPNEIVERCGCKKEDVYAWTSRVRKGMAKRLGIDWQQAREGRMPSIKT